jgi:hypothetical protein
MQMFDLCQFTFCWRTCYLRYVCPQNATWRGFACETGSSAVSESSTRNRNGFGERLREILRVCWHGGLWGATPTFATVFKFTGSKPRFFRQQLTRWGYNSNVAGQQPQPSQWTLPPKSVRRVVHTISGAPYGKAVQLHAWQWVHSTEHSAAVITRNYLLFWL